MGCQTPLYFAVTGAQRAGYDRSEARAELEHRLEIQFTADDATLRSALNFSNKEESAKMKFYQRYVFKCDYL